MNEHAKLMKKLCDCEIWQFLQFVGVTHPHKHTLKIHSDSTDVPNMS